MTNVDVPMLSQRAKQFCPDAEAISVSDPFLLSRTPVDLGEAVLGLHIRCYGRGLVKGRDLSDLDAAQVNSSIEVAAHLDNWLYTRGDGYWILENVLLFDVDAHQTQFRSLFETWDESDESARLNRPLVHGANVSFKHPIAILAACGTSQTPRCD